MAHRSSAPNAGRVSRADVITEPRRAPASFALCDASGAVSQSGEAEALIADDALIVGAVSVSYLDADVLHLGDYRIELELWPGGRLVLSQLGRRFETFAGELRRIRNQARVAGLLAHGVTMPDVFHGAVSSAAASDDAEIQVFDTHVTIVPAKSDPWQIPLGALSEVRSIPEPPAIELHGTSGLTMLRQLGRRRAACGAAIVERREVQRRQLAELTGQSGFADGWALPRPAIRDFAETMQHFTVAERVSCRETLLAAATGEPRLGFVQLLDVDGDGLEGPSSLPANWASFLLVPVGSVTVLEILAGPAAATYVFREGIDAVNRDLQLMHFRRAPLALTESQAALTSDNPHRLALRKLDPLKRLRSVTVARLMHTAGWSAALQSLLPTEGARAIASQP